MQGPAESAAESDRAQAPPRGGMNGLVLIVLLVAGGMGITSVYYHWKAPAIVAERKAALASMSTDAEPMLDMWLDFGAPAIHARLLQMRVAESAPWLVTQAGASRADGEPPDLWGIDLSELAPSWVHREGLVVVLELPAPRHLGRGWIGPDKELGVPRLAAGLSEPPPGAAAARAVVVCQWALERLVKALSKDIPGATLEVRVASPAAEQP